MPANVVTVYPHTLRLLVLQVLAAAVVTGSVAGVLLGVFGHDWLMSSGRVVVALVGAVVACFCGALVSIAAFGGRPRVEIGPEGFVTRTAFGSRTRRWGDIEGEFVVIRLGPLRGVGYHLTPAFKESARTKPTTAFAGNDEAISGVYRVPVGELVALLNEHKRRSSGAS